MRANMQGWRDGDIENLGVFLVQYASALLSSGAYTSRVSRCTQRIGESYGYDVNIIVWLRYIHLSITQKNNYENRRTQIKSNKPPVPNFRVIAELSALSWQIFDDKITLKEATSRFENIMKNQNHGFLSTLFFVSCANTAFCGLFDGDIGALLCVFVGTCVGFLSRALLMKLKVDVRGIYVIVAFISSFVTYIGVHLGITRTPEIAIGLSILYLMPGIQTINAFADILHEYTLMALSRAMNVVIALICIAVGMYCTLSITHMSIIHV